MEIGFAFEDEDLECGKKNRIGDRDVPYNVKICSDKWFDEALRDFSCEKSSQETHDSEQHQKILKFSADFSYNEKDYQTAAKKYETLLGTLSSRNTSALCHDVKESLSRCYVYTNDFDQGLNIARKMVNSAATVDEARQRQALVLLSFVCEKAKNWAECADSLERLCELQPQFPQTFHKVGDIYNHILKESPTNEKITLVKQLSSYIRAKFLFESVMGTASDFVYDRNIAYIKQLTLKIEQVPMPFSKKEFATEFIRKEMEKQVTNHKDDSSNEKQLATKESAPGEFYENFCLWNSFCER